MNKHNHDDRRIDIILIIVMSLLGVGMLMIGNRPIHYVIGIGSISIAYLWGWMATHDKP